MVGPGIGLKRLGMAPAKAQNRRRGAGGTHRFLTPLKGLAFCFLGLSPQACAMGLRSAACVAGWITAKPPVIEFARRRRLHSAMVVPGSESPDPGHPLS